MQGDNEINLPEVPKNEIKEDKNPIKEKKVKVKSKNKVVVG